MTKDLLAALKSANGTENGSSNPFDTPEPGGNPFEMDAYKGVNPFDSTVPIETGPSYMSDFFEQVEQIRSLIDEIQSNIDQAVTQQNVILSSPTQDPQMKERLEEIMYQIKRSANVTRGKLKNIQTKIDQTESINPTSADLRIMKTQHSTLSRKFVDTMNEFNNCQLAYRDNCKSRLKRQLEIADNPLDDDKIEEMLESDNPAIFTQGIMTDTNQAKQMLRDIEARHGDILKLEKSIKELHDMFIDISLLVESQGEMIDRIEYNVAQAVDHVKSAKEQTTKAVKFQSKARRKKIIIISVVCGIILVVVLVIVLSVVLKDKI